MKTLIKYITIVLLLAPLRQLVFYDISKHSFRTLRALRDVTSKRQLIQCLFLRHAQFVSNGPCTQENRLSDEEKNYTTIIGRIVKSIVFKKKTCLHLAKKKFYRQCKKEVNKEVLQYSHFNVSTKKEKKSLGRVVNYLVNAFRYLQEYRDNMVIKQTQEPVLKGIGDFIQKKVTAVLGNEHNKHPRFNNITVNLYNNTSTHPHTNVRGTGKEFKIKKKRPFMGFKEKKQDDPIIKQRGKLRYEQNFKLREQLKNKSHSGFKQNTGPLITEKRQADSLENSLKNSLDTIQKVKYDKVSTGAVPQYQRIKSTKQHLKPVDPKEKIKEEVIDQIKKEEELDRQSDQQTLKKTVEVSHQQPIVDQNQSVVDSGKKDIKQGQREVVTVSPPVKANIDAKKTVIKVDNTGVAVKSDKETQIDRTARKAIHEKSQAINTKTTENTANSDVKSQKATNEYQKHEIMHQNDSSYLYKISVTLLLVSILIA